MRGGRPHRHAERLLLGRVGIGGLDEAVGRHLVDHPVAPLERTLVLAERMIIVRRLRQRGEIGGFRDGQLVDRLVEISERGGGDAIGAEAEIDFVEVELEDLVLGIGALDLERQQRFLDLARQRHLVGEQEVLGDLLGDGGGALRAAAAAVVLHEGDRRARDAGEIEPAMLVEVLVLGGEEGVDHQLRHRLDRDVQPPLARIFGEQRAVGRMHARHHRRLVILQLRIVRQVLGEVPRARRRRRGHAHHEQDGAGGEQEAEEAQQTSHEQPVPRRCRRRPPEHAHSGSRDPRQNGVVIVVAPPAGERRHRPKPRHSLLCSLGFMLKLRPGGGVSKAGAPARRYRPRCVFHVTASHWPPRPGAGQKRYRSPAPALTPCAGARPAISDA